LNKNKNKIKYDKTLGNPKLGYYRRQQKENHNNSEGKNKINKR
jgi:hypothetical protein